MKRDGIRQLGPGKWIVQIYRAGERRSRVVYGTRTDARYERAKLLVELEQRPGVADPSVVSFAELSAAWWEWAEGRKLNLHGAKYRRPVLDEHFGERAAAQIERHEVLAFRETLIQDGLKPATVNHYVKLMGRIYNHAVEFNLYTGRSPVYQIKSISAQNRRTRDLSDADVSAIVGSATQRHARRAFIWLRLTGLRVSELLALRQDEIDRERMQIRPRAVEHGNKRRGIAPVCGQLITDLDRNPGVYVIEYAGGKLGSVRKSWDGARGRVGLPDAWLHDLRRSFVSHLRGLEVQHDLIDFCVGHVSPGARAAYNVLNPVEVSRVAELLTNCKAIANITSYLPEK